MPGFRINISGHTKELVERMQNATKLRAGIHYRSIMGRPSEIQKKINAFYKEMMERYPDFEVISTDIGAMIPTDICFGITFKV